MDRQQLLEKLTNLDFMSMDLLLYLDTHPHCEKGLHLYNKITSESKQLREIFEEKYGAIRSYDCPNPSPWNWLWIEEPFPWEE